MANRPLASPSLLDIPLQSSDSAVSIPASETSVSNSEQSNIAIIGAAAFLRASKLPGSHNFELCLRSSDIQANSTKLAETPDLSNVPSKYHKFADIFNKTKAEVLAPHCPYDLKINLEENVQPLVGPIYSLSASEQETLKELIEKNLNTGFIQPISSLHSALVSDMVHTRGESPQYELGDMQTCWMTLASAYVLCCLSAAWLQLQIIGRSLRWEWVLIWCVTIEHRRLSSIRIYLRQLSN